MGKESEYSSQLLLEQGTNSRAVYDQEKLISLDLRLGSLMLGDADLGLQQHILNTGPFRWVSVRCTRGEHSKCSLLPVF